MQKCKHTNLGDRIQAELDEYGEYMAGLPERLVLYAEIPRHWIHNPLRIEVDHKLRGLWLNFDGDVHDLAPDAVEKLHHYLGKWLAEQKNKHK